MRGENILNIRRKIFQKGRVVWGRFGIKRNNASLMIRFRTDDGGDDDDATWSGMLAIVELCEI